MFQLSSNSLGRKKKLVSATNSRPDLQTGANNKFRPGLDRLGGSEVLRRTANSDGKKKGSNADNEEGGDVEE